MSDIVGNVSGFRYSIEPPSKEGPSCGICARWDLPLLKPAGISSPLHICEPCTTLAAWIWRHRSGDALPFAYPTEPSAALVLIVRERSPIGWEALMVGRKDSPGHFGLPGGKIEPGESPVAAALRELKEETGLDAWEKGCEEVYTGFSSRGRLVRTFLCRAYAGTPPVTCEGQPVAWQPMPLQRFAGHLGGYYMGLEHAFATRVRLQEQAGAPRATLTVPFTRPAIEFLKLRKEYNETKSKDLARFLEATSMSLTKDEKDLINNLICPTEIDYQPEPVLLGQQREEFTHDQDDENAAPGMVRSALPKMTER